MRQTRLEQLLQFLKEEPNDPFLLYAVAMEYSKTDISKALSFYEKLLNEYPDYIATYYHAAKLFAELGDRDKAEHTFITGIEKAKSQQEALALRELQNAYNEFLFEE